MSRSDFPTARFIERRSVVAVVPEAQADEPPGRGNVREREVIVAAYEADLLPADVQATVARLGAGMPRRRMAEPFASREVTA